MTSFTRVGVRFVQGFTTRVLEQIEAAAQRLNATRVDPDGRSFVTAVVDAATDSILVFVYDFHDKLREVGAFIFATDAPSRVELAVSVNLFSIERIESVGCRSFVAPAWFVEQDLRSSWCARRETIGAHSAASPALTYESLSNGHRASMARLSATHRSSTHHTQTEMRGR